MGLLDWFNTGTTPPNPDATLPQMLASPMGQGLLGAVFSYAANARRGQPINNIGRGGLGGLLAYQNAGQEDLKRKYMQAQMDNLSSEVKQREAQTAKLTEGMKFVQSMLGANSYVPGQLGSGSFGAVSNNNPMAPPVSSGLASATPEQIATAKLYGFDLMEPWKIAKQGFEQKPGMYRVDPTTNRMTYIPNPVDGRTVDANGRVGLMPGSSQATLESTLATELPKAVLASAGKVNLRPNADGTQTPVVELSENPLLQSMVGQVFGAAPQRAPQPNQPARQTPMVVSPEDQRAADAESIRMIQAELKNPRLSASDREAMTREIQRLTASQSAPGFPQPTMTKPSYGKTTAQEITDAATRAGKVKQAEADVRPTEQRQNDIASANYMLSVIDQAINHPGREVATGLSGTIDPRNYLPGTNAKGFNSLLDQIRGSTFMQAYQNLKGGGQITEVEGKKAENAIARLNTAQSDDEFLGALKELRQVVSNGLTRQKGVAQTGGATGSFAGDNSEMVKRNVVSALPKMAAKGTRARDTTTGDILEFNGMSWVKAK